MLYCRIKVCKNGNVVILMYTEKIGFPAVFPVGSTCYKPKITFSRKMLFFGYESAHVVNFY